MKRVLLLLIPLLLKGPICTADTYEAAVTTNSGTYSVPVEVDGDEVTFVHWPNGGNMHVYGATLEDGIAEGTNSRGEAISIEVQDFEESQEYDRE